MALDEDGFDFADDWLYWLANGSLLVPLICILIYVLTSYSHVGDRFGRQLSTFSVLATFAAVLFRVITFFYKHWCAFYLIETVYFVCEFNLFQFRTALFYQSDKKFYNRLYHLCAIFNCTGFYHNLIYFGVFQRVDPLEFGCRSVPGLGSYAAAVPIYAIQSYMLYLGFYTVRKFWRESGEEARRKMRILWLVLFTYTWDYISGLFLLMFTETSGKILLFREAFQFFNKFLSLLLALMVYLKIRERSTTTKMTTNPNAHTSRTKNTKDVAPTPTTAAKKAAKKGATSTPTSISSISGTERPAGI